MCFDLEPRTHYYYHEEVIPTRKSHSRPHHSHYDHHQRHRHRHRSHPSRTSYSSVSLRSCSTGPRVSVPSMYEVRRGRPQYA